MYIGIKVLVIFFSETRILFYENTKHVIEYVERNSIPFDPRIICRMLNKFIKHVNK